MKVSIIVKKWINHVYEYAHVAIEGDERMVKTIMELLKTEKEFEIA